jgi:hypothetical protein
MLPDIPVLARSFQPSPKTIEMRQIHELLPVHDTENPQEKLGYQESQRRWAALIDRYDAVSQRLFAKRRLNWGHVAELAEVAWFWAPKEERYSPDNFIYCTGRLARDPKSGFHARYHSKFELAANAALIEAVIALSGARRYDCRMERYLGTWWAEGQANETEVAHG